MSALIPEIAMVFAAGLGTRMRPLTNHLPKPLVKVKGQALIDWTLDDLAEVGVKTAIVNVHHLADQIEQHLAGRHNPRILISDERPLLLDQAGGIRKALPLIGATAFYICNTDAFWFGAKQSNLLRLAQVWDPEKWISRYCYRRQREVLALIGRAILILRLMVVCFGQRDQNPLYMLG